MAAVEKRRVSDVAEAGRLRESLAARSRGGQGRFWDFSGTWRARADEEVLFQYPAMMVSPMQGALLDVLTDHRSGPMRVFDPFVGSGTTLIEAMRRGLPYAGSDLNPLAVMLARVETAEAAHFDMVRSLEATLLAAGDARGAVAAPDDVFSLRWFREDVRVELAALRAAIAAQPEVRLRRLWWVCLSEVVRLASNARLSTPKLQTRPLDELARPIDVQGRFEQLAIRACGVLARRSEAMRAAGYLCSGRYVPGVDLMLADARELPLLDWPADLVLTSPPYGDNHTTMPYGQASFLPLLWIDTADAEVAIPEHLLASSRSLDTCSLGGSRKTALGPAPDWVTGQSARLDRLMAVLHRSSYEAWQRVAAFFADYARALDSILDQCAPDAHLVFTLGDRTVRGLCVPTTEITRQLLAARGLVHVDTLHRAIPHNKRIARRNELVSTIGSETVLIMARAG